VNVVDHRFPSRLNEMLAQAVVTPDVLSDLLPRLELFIVPFVETLVGAEQKRHTAEYISGLLSNLDHKTGEGIAYLHDQPRQGIQKFIGHIPWDHQPVLMTLASQVGHELGEPDGILVFDPSSFPKKGTQSVGVGKPWCGRLGKVENCQVGIYLGYVTRREHALVDVRLDLPEDWTKDRARCAAAGVPKSIRFRTRHQLALAMLEECGGSLPHAWIAGDDEMGRPSGFRRGLRTRGERYLLAVPSNTVVRDIEAPLPEYSGRGRHPKNPWVRLDDWAAAVPEEAWTRVEVRDGEKGPLVIEVVKRRVQARTETGGTGPEETLLVTRERQADGTFKHDYYLSNCAAAVPLEELARVAKAAHRIEECFERAKGEAGLADYQVRNWIAWHHHQTLSLLAAWFLNQEARRGKNPDPRANRPAAETIDCGIDRRAPRGAPAAFTVPPQHSLAASQRGGQVLSSSIT
jgi:SRSO17 transposase